jgi:hypothetical protein
MKRTESFENYWERQRQAAEKALDVAIKNLGKVAMHNQLQLFDTSGQVLPLQREVIADTA